MILTMVTFELPQATSLADITKAFESTAPRYRGLQGLVRKNYWMSEDGRRAGGIYLWETRADAERLYTPEWTKMVTEKYGKPPRLEYLHAPVMVDNREGRIVAA